MAKIYILQAESAAFQVKNKDGKDVTVTVKSRLIEPSERELNLHQLLAKYHPGVERFWLYSYNPDTSDIVRKIRYGIIEE
jgi:hypothetical protein